MFEDQMKFPMWVLAIKNNEGVELPYMQADPDVSQAINMGSITIAAACQSCNRPGGGAGEHGKPGEQDFCQGQKPCTQSENERGRCPAIRSVVRDSIHAAGLCSVLNCETCKRKGSVGKMRVDDVVTIHAQRVAHVNTQAGPMAMLQGYAFVGRYLGMDQAGHSMRFEMIAPGEGPSGLRAWLTSSGVFIEDVGPDVQKQIDEGKAELAKPSNMLLPESACPCGSGRQYRQCCMNKKRAN